MVRRLSDAVWSIDRRRADGHVQTVHVLIEHQSSVGLLDGAAVPQLRQPAVHQRRYRDRPWRKGDTGDQVLHVVLYNGATRWDAPRSLAGLVPTSPEEDGPAQLALSYEVVDLVALAADELPRPNLISWVANVERSRHTGELAERVRESGQAQEEQGAGATFLRPLQRRGISDARQAAVRRADSGGRARPAGG